MFQAKPMFHGSNPVPKEPMYKMVESYSTPPTDFRVSVLKYTPVPTQIVPIVSNTTSK